MFNSKGSRDLKYSKKQLHFTFSQIFRPIISFPLYPHQKTKRKKQKTKKLMKTERVPRPASETLIS